MKSLLNILAFFFFCFFVLRILISIYEKDIIDYADNADTFSCEEYSMQDTLTYSSIHHQRSWMDSRYWGSYCTSYTIEDASYDRSLKYRNNLPDESSYETFHGYWGSIYQYLLEFESERLYDLQDSLKDVGIRNSLNRVDFADMVVSLLRIFLITLLWMTPVMSLMTLLVLQIKNLDCYPQ